MQNSNKQKNIIALSCSPSKGRNSDTMLDHFIKGVRKVPNVNIEKIYINDISFDTYAYENKNGPESHEKEFKSLCDKVQSCNGLIIATPTYNFSVPAQLKNFIDRIRFFALDFKRKTKLKQPVGMLGYLSLYFLASGGTPTWAQKILFFAFPLFWLRGVFLYFGAKCMGAIYSGDIKTFENTNVLKKCEKAGRRYAYQVLEEKHHGILERIFWRPPQID